MNKLFFHHRIQLEKINSGKRCKTVIEKQIGPAKHENQFEILVLNIGAKKTSDPAPIAVKKREESFNPC